MAIQQSQTVEKRQKIRGLALGLLCAAFALSGCERSEEEPLALLTLDKERIVFDNPAESETAQAVLRIEADRRWSVGFIGNGHDCRVSVSSGEAGVHELRIETSETNTGRDLHRLGQLTVALDDGSANRTVDLQQRPQAARQTLLMYFCGTDLYSYYKNNLSDVAQGALAEYPAAGPYRGLHAARRRRRIRRGVPLRRSGERLRTRHADPLYAAARAHDRSCGHGTHPRRHGGRRARRTFRAPSGLPRKGMVAGIDRKFVMAAQQRPSHRRSVAEDTRCGRNPLVRP